MDTRSDLLTLARGLLLNVFGTVTSGAVSFALAAVVARGFGRESAGVFFEAYALLTIAAVLSQLGAPDGVVWMLSRFKALHQLQNARGAVLVACLPVLGVSLVVALGMGVFAPEIARVVINGADRDTAVTYIRAAAVALPLTTLGAVLMPTTRALQSMVATNVVENIGKPLLRLACVVAAVAYGAGARPLWLALVLPPAIGFLVTLWWTERVLAAAGRTAEPGADVREAGSLSSEFWRFTGFRALSTALQVGLLWLDVLLIGALQSSGDAGVYTAASRYMAAGGMFLTAVILVIAPQIGALLAQKQYDRAETVYQTAASWLTVASFPALIWMATFATLMMELFGPGYQSGVNTLRILALASLVNMATGPIGMVLLMGGKSSWNLANSAIGLSSNVILNAALIPTFGMTGAATAWAVSILLTNVFNLVLVRRFWGMQPFSALFPVLVGVAAICFGVVGLVLQSAFGHSPAVAAASLLIGSPPYILFVWRSRSALHLTALRDAVAFRAGQSRRRAAAEVG